MPRSPNHSREEIIERALPLFWRKGYNVTSIDDLVRHTGVSRHALYLEFGGKRDLFTACLDAYRDTVVTPAFSRVERRGAGLTDIAAFFEHQIAFAENSGQLGIGCLFANTMTEMAPHDAEIGARVRAHHERLRAGFAAVLRRAAQGKARSAAGKSEALAGVLATATQGLWSTSRALPSASGLRGSAATLIRLVEKELFA